MHCVQDALRQRYGIAANNAHRALDDTLILLEVLPKLLQDNGTPDITDVMDLGTKATGSFADLLGPGISSQCYPLLLVL